MFDDFLREVAKPSWWMGVVVVGFLINLGSAYAKPFLDNVLGRFWLSSKEAARRKEALVVKCATKLLDSPLLVVELKLDILRYTLRAVMCTATAIVSFLFIIVLNQDESITPILTSQLDLKNALQILNLLFYFFGCILFLLATVIFVKSFNGDRILRAYRRLKKEAESNNAQNP
jgi:hypothetical protein